MEMPKLYETVACLGAETSTDDASGEIISSNGRGTVSEKDIDLALSSFMGWRMQAPPDVSAVHVDGRRAHELVREDMTSISKRNLSFSALLQEQANIRRRKSLFTDKLQERHIYQKLCKDMGQLLGCGAYVSELKSPAAAPSNLIMPWMPHYWNI